MKDSVICTTCDGLGVERREITNPAQNVYGWLRCGDGGGIYTRACERCNGTGFVTSGQSVPIVPDDPRRIPPSRA